MDPIERLKHDLSGPDIELRETHISLVFMHERTVYKVKKPVSLGFLDFSELSTRKALCEREVELNARLAPDVYRRVVPITAAPNGALRIGGEGDAIEWAVEMRRLPDRDSAEARLREGRLGLPETRRIAERIARFHAEARSDEQTTQAGSWAVVEQNVRENFEATRTSALESLSSQELADIERFQLAFLEQHRARFEARERAARVRDGHGDLRLEHCYLSDRGELSIIDCIEFNDRFRYADVCSDIAFLAMDFAWHGRHDLSEALLAAYAQLSGDYDLYGLVDFYESYRAFVRGKVASILAADAHADAAVRARAAAQARKYFLLAKACSREPALSPALYAVGGVIASGKSTVAGLLGELSHAPVVDADRTRKQLAGVDVTTPLRDAAFTGHYSAARTAAVYGEVLRRAEVVLSSRRPVVVDASFRRADQRAAARALAQRMGVPFTFIECRADLDTCRARLALRAQAPSVSDGRLEVLEAFARSFEPVSELPVREHVALDTTRPLDEHLGVLRSLAGIR